MEILFFLFIILPMISVVWFLILFVGAGLAGMSVEAFREKLKRHGESQEAQERIRKQGQTLEESRRAVGDTNEVLWPWQVRRLVAEEEALRFEEEQARSAAAVQISKAKAARARSSKAAAKRRSEAEIYPRRRKRLLWEADWLDANPEAPVPEAHRQWQILQLQRRISNGKSFN